MTIEHAVRIHSALVAWQHEGKPGERGYTVKASGQDHLTVDTVEQRWEHQPSSSKQHSITFTGSNSAHMTPEQIGARLADPFGKGE